MSRQLTVVLLTALLACACSTDPSGSGGDDDSYDDGGPIDPDARDGTGDDIDAGGPPDPSAPDAGDVTPPTPTVADLLALVAACDDQIGGLYATDGGDAENIPVCALAGAVFWKADLDVDCDGQETAVCNGSTDPSFQNRTSATQSDGEWLDASTLPYVVVPLPSDRFDYESAGLQLGTVIAVIYDGKLEFGVFGDQGPNDIIGEASYRMAQLLGIDPDPATGGIDTGVTYIAFTGDTAVVGTMEDHAEAVTIGEERVQELLLANAP